MSVLRWEAVCSNPALVGNGLRDFSHVRCYHLCRPAEPDSYRQHGIWLPSTDRLFETFDRIYSDYPAEQREAAKAAYVKQNGEREVRIDFTLDPRWIEVILPHYTGYGSEALQDLAVILPDKPKERLRDRGKPTVLVVDVPTDRLSYGDRDELEEALRDLRDGDRGSDEPLDFTVSLTEAVPPDWITATRAAGE